ncbi:hypothetical protein ACFQO1_03700 [Jejudonia soesokkakensis]|uniref:Outer membrane protein beta-barrel domain-containing protein n=1 Tax=Jejudonia soesokkakensis TaxID=1323432 RepID=A0ABW2MSC7_9FLAO
MKKSIFYLLLASMLVSVPKITAQEENPKSKIELLRASKEVIIAEEKEALKKEVEAIMARQEANEITKEVADALKKEAAERRALNIENRLAIIDNKIALFERNGEDSSENKVSIFSDGKTIDIQLGAPKEREYDLRTTSDLVFAVGFNNVITKGESLDDSDFKIGGSRFAELGWAWKTRVFKESNWLRVKYGFSFQFNGLKPTDNRYYVENGDQTILEEYPLDLKKSKFRQDNLVFPLHFEFGPSEKIEKEDYFRYNTHNKLKFGIGGYAGFNLSSRQKLKFKEDGEEVKLKLKDDYNTNNFIYGVSAYLGWRGTALYAKYDLNPIFKDNPIEQRNISLGLRFDMD